MTQSKNWQSSSPSVSNNVHGSVSGANYPRQQYIPAQQNAYGTTHYTQPNQPQIINNNIITHNHAPSYVHTPGVSYSGRKSTILIPCDFFWGFLIILY